VHFAHESADETLHNPAFLLLAQVPKAQVDSILRAAALKRFSVELTSVIDEHRLGQSLHIPRGLDSKASKALRLPSSDACYAKSYGCRRWSLQGNHKANNCTTKLIYSESNSGTTNGLTASFVYEDKVSGRMIDLDHF
jgi:hypothetical protein